MLPVTNIVNVTINLSPTAAAVRSFGVLMIAGDSDVINGLERFRTYLDIDAVALDFGVEAPEYLAAAKYFGQTPKPKTLMIGRWLRTATAGENLGGILSAAEQALARWTVISAGAFQVSINGSNHSLTGLDFTGVTNLNGVATVISTALSTYGTCVWTGSEFVVKSSTTGAGVEASGTVTFDTNPANNDTLTLNGTALTFKTSPTLAHDILIGATAAATAANVQAWLNANAADDSNLSGASYSTSGTVLTVSFSTVGTSGNSYTLAKSSTHITLSGATLAGGTVASSVGYATAGASGTDIATQLKLTALTNIAIVPGYAAESPVEAVVVFADRSPAWYGLMFAASTQPTDNQSLAVSDFIEALDLRRMYGVSITDTGVLSSLVTTDLASEMKARNYRQSFCQYSSSFEYVVASLFGRAFTVNFAANNTTITLMFKQEPGVVAEEITANEALTLKSKRCNVFVAYNNDTAILQYGVMSGPVFIDDTHGLDWLQNAIQTAVYNVLYTSTTKIPQTDAGVNKLVNAIDQVCGQAVSNGLVAPGVWNADGFGQLNTGDFLKTGYYIYAQPVALQSQSDREARIAPPIQVAIKLAGAIQSVDVLVNVNR